MRSRAVKCQVTFEENGNESCTTVEENESGEDM